MTGVLKVDGRRRKKKKSKQRYRDKDNRTLIFISVLVTHIKVICVVLTVVTLKTIMQNDGEIVYTSSPLYFGVMSIVIMQKEANHYPFKRYNILSKSAYTFR